MKAPNDLVPALWSLPLLALLLACGGPAPELALEGPSSLALTWGGSEAVELTLERNKTANGELTLSVEGLPDGVTAHFEPGTVAADALSATLHLEAARDAAAAASLVTVRATGADALVAEHVFLLEVSGLTVTGSIESILGETVPVGVPVKVGSQWVATDGAGAFVVHNVAVPYDLAIKGTLVTEVYLGLTSPTPQVKAFLDESVVGEWPSVNIDLTITPTPALNEMVEVCSAVSLPYLSRCRRLYGNGVTDTLSIDVDLHGGPAAPRQLVARRFVRNVEGLTTAYTGHGSAAVPYAPGLSVAFDLSLSPSSSTEIPYSVQLPESPTATVDDRHGRVAYGAFINGEQTLAPDVFHLPDGATGSITVSIDDPSNESYITTIWPVHGPLDGPITFAPPTVALTPASGAVITRTTEFRTSDPGGGLASHIFNANSGGAGRIFFVHTFEDHVPFSVLETLLEDLLPSDLVEWNVISMPQVRTPEQATEEVVGYLAEMFTASPSNGAVPLSAPVQLTGTYPRTFSVPVGGSSAVSIDERLEALLPR